MGEAAADRFRRMHLIGALAFLPYGVCVDHFQHEVYANPDATPAERHAMWARLEKIYMPWTDYGDLAFLPKGGRWQAKPHIYGSPFYYIDYTLAQCCAMQFWVKSRRDYAGAMEDYVALCAPRRLGAVPGSGAVRRAGVAVRRGRAGRRGAGSRGGARGLAAPSPNRHKTVIRTQRTAANRCEPTQVGKPSMKRRTLLAAPIALAAGAGRAPPTRSRSSGGTR